MKSVRSLAVFLPVYAVIVSWSLMAQGQGGNQPQPPALFPGDPLVASLKWRNVGNANLVGRISAIDALDTLALRVGPRRTSCGG